MKRILRTTITSFVVITTAVSLPASASDTDQKSPTPAAAAQAPPPAVIEEDYTIGPGDVLNIAVWENEDLTLPLAVLPDGTISFPLIGTVSVAERTVNEIKKEIEEKLTPYIPDPVLSLWVYQVNSMIVYVIGRVNRPGDFKLNSNITVLQALAMAGGLNPFAERGNIKIFRKNDKSTNVFEFNYDDVSRGKHLEQNIVLKRGDVIVVP